MGYFRKRLLKKSIWKKIFLQRLTEPLHLNVLAVFVFIFGSYRQKIAYDLVLRNHNAFGILNAAEQAKQLGLKGISIFEFGVANGAGLMNMIKISGKVSKITGVNIKVFGFDTGEGMPEPADYRDHPEYYGAGDFPMNLEILKKNISGKAELILGEIDETLPPFLKSFDNNFPIGYVVVDVDYYSSTQSVLKLFEGRAENFLPRVNVYFDDIFMPNHNSKCGELLAIDEFNSVNAQRQLEPHQFLEYSRIFKKNKWIRQMYFCHILDHKIRSGIRTTENRQILDNPYLDFEGNQSKFY